MATPTHRRRLSRSCARASKRSRASSASTRWASRASTSPRTRRTSSAGLPSSATAAWTTWRVTAAAAAARRSSSRARCASSACAWQLRARCRARAAVLDDGGKGYIARYALGRDYHKLLRGRLGGARDAARRGVRALRLPRLRRLGAGHGEAARAQCRARLDRQAHEPHQRARRIAVHARRAVHRPAAAGRRTRQGSLRQLQRLPAGLPDRRNHGALPARRAPLHLLPHDRAPRRDPRGAPAGDRQPRLRLRRLPARLSLEQVRAGRRRAGLPRAPPARRAGPGRAVRLERGGVPREHARAARCAGSASAGGSATSRSRSATRRPRRAAAALARARGRRGPRGARARRLGAHAPGGASAEPG